MNSKRAKILRKIAGETREKREYQLVKSPGQYLHNSPRTIIANHERHFYQTLKGRRGLPRI